MGIRPTHAGSRLNSSFRSSPTVVLRDRQATTHGIVFAIDIGVNCRPSTCNSNLNTWYCLDCAQVLIRCRSSNPSTLGSFYTISFSQAQYTTFSQQRHEGTTKNTPTQVQRNTSVCTIHDHKTSETGITATIFNSPTITRGRTDSNNDGGGGTDLNWIESNLNISDTSN